MPVILTKKRRQVLLASCSPVLNAFTEVGRYTLTLLSCLLPLFSSSIASKSECVIHSYSLASSSSSILEACDVTLDYFFALFFTPLVPHSNGREENLPLVHK